MLAHELHEPVRERDVEAQLPVLVVLNDIEFREGPTPLRQEWLSIVELRESAGQWPRPRLPGGNHQRGSHRTDRLRRNRRETLEWRPSIGAGSDSAGRRIRATLEVRRIDFGWVSCRPSTNDVAACRSAMATLVGVGFAKTLPEAIQVRSDPPPMASQWDSQRQRYASRQSPTACPVHQTECWRARSWSP